MGKEIREQIAEQAKMAVMQSRQQQRDIQTQALEHEMHNKAHDTMLSEYSQGAGQNETLNRITEEDIHNAYERLMKYKTEKAVLERRIAENEEFWKLKHWELMQTNDDKRIHPKSAWLFNLIINKHADAMDNIPEANILPRARDDEAVAKALSDIIPVILEQNDFEETYDKVQWYKGKNGTGFYGVFWDNNKQNGLGDIDIRKVDISNLYWKGGINDIQESPEMFLVKMISNDELKRVYPNINPTSPSSLLPISAESNYKTEEQIDQTNQSAVIDWYYKVKVPMIDDNGIPHTKTKLHFCKFCNDQIIYASENDPNYAEKGWYQHGQYPFVPDVLYPVENSVCGMGYIDICKDAQMFIDKMEQAIIENAIVNARPRFIIRGDGGINEDEFNDISKAVLHTEGNLGEDSFRQVAPTPLAPIYENVLQYKIQELKDTSGNTAASQGQASAVTSASGIASLQEAAGKLSRDTNLSSYRAFKKVVELVIELIREFYDEPRCFRITGELGQNEFVDFDNSGLKPQSQGSAFGLDLGSRLPIMDIDIKPQKKNAYSKDAQNQTAINLYNLGFFSPNNADASMACLDMMEFDQIEKVKDKVQQNGLLYQQLMQMQQTLLQLAQIVDADHPGQNITEQLSMQYQQMGAIGAGGKTGSVSDSKGSLSSQAASATRGSTAVQ